MIGLIVVSLIKPITAEAGIISTVSPRILSMIWIAIYVGGTKFQLNKRISIYSFKVNQCGNQVLYRHFNLPDHSILSFKVRILEKKHLSPYE